MVHALEIENGRINVYRSEEGSRVEKWNGSSVGRIEISIEISSVEWKFGICRIVMNDPYGLPYVTLLSSFSAVRARTALAGVLYVINTVESFLPLGACAAKD